MPVYEIAKLIHLVSAVIFGGVLFVEVVMLPVLKKELGEDMYKKIEYLIISKRGIKVVPLFVLALYVSGFYMFHVHLKSLDLSTNFGKLLILKVFLAVLIIIGVITAIILFIRGRQESKIFDYIHLFAFVLAFSIIIIAKLMFVL